MKKILLIRVDALGDLILTLPAILAIREFYDDAEVDMVVRNSFAAFMHETNLVNNIIPFGESIIPLFFCIGKKEYDLAIDLTPASTLNSSLLLFFAHAKEKAGYNVGIRKYWLTTPIIPGAIKYEKDMVFEICRQMDIPVKKKRLFFPSNEKKKITANFPLAREIGGKLIIAVHPSASKKEKMWPSECFIELINRLIKRYNGMAFVFVGTKEERKYCDWLNSQLTTKQINLAGELSIIELGNFLSNCNLLICNNSGPMHIGAAVGIPLVILNIVSSNERWIPKGGIVKVFNATAEDIEQCKKERIEITTMINVNDVYNACLEVIGYEKV